MWGVMGFIFGPFALPFVILLPDKKNQENTGDQDSSSGVL